MTDQSTVYTVGHSTRTVERFIEILLASGVNVLVDVRRFPKSARNPQFNTESLRSDLSKYGIRYEWFEGLGGRRDGAGDRSLNKCWRSKSFRNYADHMETDTFRQAARELIELVSENRVAVMCAEATYWRCHRFLISDYLKAEGVRVMHLLDVNQSTEHEFSDCARVRNGKLTYYDTSNLDAYTMKS